MPNRILALDLQGSHLAAVMVESSFRSVRFVGHFFEPRDRSKPLGAELRDLVARHGITADTVLSALPGSAATYRILDLPFRDRRKLQQIVPFELESQVPFSLDDSIVDFQVLARSEGGSRVFAALVPRSAMEEHLKALAEAGLDPAVVDFAPLTTLNVLQLFEGDRPGRYAFLHVSPKQGTVALYRDGNLEALRVFDVTGEPAVLAREVCWSLRTFDGGPPEAGEALPLLVGGSSPPELARLLREQMSVTVQRLEDLPLRQIPEELRDQQGEYAPAIGLALREIADAPTLGLNFRRDEFAYHRGRQELRQSLARLGVLFAVVAALFFSWEIVSVLELARDHEALRGAIRKAFVQTLPDVKPIIDEKEQLSKEIDRLQKERQQFGVGGAASALEILRELSLRAPAEPRMNVEELSLEPDALHLRAKTSSFEAVDTVRKSLADSPLFREVQVKDPRSTPDSNVEFRLNVLFGKAED